MQCSIAQGSKAQKLRAQKLRAQKLILEFCSIIYIMIAHILAFAFAELVDNALAATAGNKGLRKIEIQLVSMLTTIWSLLSQWILNVSWNHLVLFRINWNPPCKVSWNPMKYLPSDNYIYIIIRVHSAFSLVASCVLLKYTRTDDVNWWRDLI